MVSRRVATCPAQTLQLHPEDSFLDRGHGAVEIREQRVSSSREGWTVKSLSAKGMVDPHLERQGCWEDDAVRIVGAL